MGVQNAIRMVSLTIQASLMSSPVLLQGHLTENDDDDDFMMLVEFHFLTFGIW